VSRLSLVAALLLAGCGDVPSLLDPTDAGVKLTTDGGAPPDGGSLDAGTVVDGGTADAGPPPVVIDPEDYAKKVSSYTPGDNAGFGQDQYPDIVMGPPTGNGNGAGSLDVLSLGKNGSIVLDFEYDILDGEGPDLIVFENAFVGFVETGFVAVSSDGIQWFEWPCHPSKELGYPNCAGVHPVIANATNGVDPTDPKTAGGDAFDLADLGVTSARYVRVRDSGSNMYAGSSGGFDLDAVAIVHRSETKR